MYLNHTINSNQRNKHTMACNKSLLSCLLIFVLFHSIHAVSVNLQLISNNEQTLNSSRFEYIVEPPVSSVNIPQQRGSSSDNKALNMPLSSTTTSANLTALTWAHAVNSQQLLDNALNSTIDMIEADIVMGKINSTGPDMPVMAHPPANSSDLSLDSFLQQIKDFNDAHIEEMKGVKLDFKSIEVFEGALETLQNAIPKMSYPVWLNADIVSGPVNQTDTVPVDPERFFVGSSRFPQAVLSIGWTTKWTSTENNGSYTTEEIAAMISAIHSNNVTASGQPITFPVRAGIAANSQDELHDLVRAVNDTNDSTLTIWSSDNDYVNVDKLRQLIFSFGFHRVYLDVPEKLANQLDLSRTDNETGKDNGASGRNMTLASLVNFSLMSAGLYLISRYFERIRV